MVWGGFIVASTGVLYTHPFVAFFYGLVIVSIAAMQCILFQTADQRKMLLIACAGTGIIALNLSSPYWLSTWYFSDKVFYGRGIGGFFSPSADFTRGAAIDKLGSYSPMSYFLYIFRWYFFPAIMVYVIYNSKQRPVFIVLAIIYCFATFMMRPVSLPIWRAIPYFSYLQYYRYN